jgi:flagellar biosynthesis chaperone FliJ
MTPKTLKRTLVIKERIRKWRHAELLEAENRVTLAQQSVEEEAARHAHTAAILTRAGEVAAHELALAADQLVVAQKALERAQSELGERIEERDLRQAEAGEATREVKAIEVLHARLVHEQRRAEDRREQSELDEAATRKRKTV